MKKFKILAILLFSVSITTYAQKFSEVVSDSTKMHSMKEVYTSYNKGVTYFLKGSKKAYTGFLYASYDNGAFESVQQFENGKGNGIWVDYAPDGKKECQGTYVNNRVEGPVTFFYEDGSVKSKGQYRDYKKPIGLWTFYDRKGNIVSKRRYTR